MLSEVAPFEVAAFEKVLIVETHSYSYRFYWSVG